MPNHVANKLLQFYRYISSSRRRFMVSAGFIILAVIFIKFKILGTSAQQQQYQTQQVNRGTLISSVTASGSVSTANSVSVATQATGVVREIYVKNGDLVKAGQAIAKLSLDQSGLQKQAAAWATYQSANNSLVSAQQGQLSADAQMWTDQQSVLNAQNNENYKNNNSINPSTKQTYTDLEKQSIESALIQAQKSFTASETKYKQSGISIAAAQAQLSSAWLSYQQASDTITAPIDGTINGMTLQLGGVITSSSGSSSSASTATSTASSGSQKVASVYTDAVPVVSVSVSEIDVPKVRMGQRATLTFDALTDKTFTGRVSSIDTSGSVSSGVTTYPVVITLDAAASDIYPNMSATANIITDTKDDVLSVPTGAIQTINGQSTVRVLKNGQVSTVPVEPGITSDTRTEITSGLSEGDQVVVSSSLPVSGRSSGTSNSPFGTSPFGIRNGGGFGGGVRIRGGGG